MPHSPAPIRIRAAALVLGFVLLAPAGAGAQWREPATSPVRAAHPLFEPRLAPGPSVRIERAGPVWGTRADLQLMAFGAALVYGAYRLNRADHPYVGASVGVVGVFTFAMGALDLIDPRRYPTPAPRDTAAVSAPGARP